MSGNSNRSYSCGIPIVVAQNSTEALPAPDIANSPPNFGARLDDPVPQALVVALPLVEPLNDMETLIPKMGRMSEDFPHGESDRLRDWPAEIGGLRPSSGAEIAAFPGSAEYFDLTG